MRESEDMITIPRVTELIHLTSPAEAGVGPRGNMVWCLCSPGLTGKTGDEHDLQGDLDCTKQASNKVVDLFHKCQEVQKERGWRSQDMNS